MNMSAPLLAETPTRSDSDTRASRSDTQQPPGAASEEELDSNPGVQMLVVVESLIPVRGYAIEIGKSATVAELKTRYLEMIHKEAEGRAAVANDPSRIEEQGTSDYDLHVRLVFDGIELHDDTKLEAYTLSDGSRIVAMNRRHEPRGIAVRGLWMLMRWWPFWLAVLAIGILLGALMVGTAATCDRPLLVFVVLAAVSLVPVAVVTSGLFQEERGHRLLWFMRYPILSRAIMLNAIFILVWLILGGVWLFGGTSSCRDGTHTLYSVSLYAWAVLLLLNLPWVVLLTVPCLLFCKSPVAFGIISRMSGMRSEG